MTKKIAPVGARNGKGPAHTNVSGPDKENQTTFAGQPPNVSGEPSSVVWKKLGAARRPPM